MRNEREKNGGVDKRCETYRILVPLLRTEGRECILWYAAAVAGACARAEVVAVDVLEVPYQTPMEAAMSNSELMTDQRVALEIAKIRANELGSDLCTRAIVGHSWQRVIRQVIREEEISHIVVEWPGSEPSEGRRSAGDVRALLHGEEVEATLVQIGGPQIGSVLALISTSPHAVAAARRAFACAKAAGDAPLTLLNVQPPCSSPLSVRAAGGRRVVHQVARRAGIPDDCYWARVLVSDQPQAELLRTARGYDTVCVGASRRSGLTLRLFGSLGGRLRRELSATVIVARDRCEYARTFIDDFMTQLWK